jgi:hypothetical protein
VGLPPSWNTLKCDTCVAFAAVVVPRLIIPSSQIVRMRNSRYRIPPTCRQERDFCRRRLARRKRLRDDISAQRPEIGDHRAREMAAKAAFSLADLDAWVSDWVVRAAR